MMEWSGTSDGKHQTRKTGLTFCERPHSIVHRTEHFKIILILRIRSSDLFQPRQTCNGYSLRSRAVQRGQEHAGEDCDDRNYHEELYEGELPDAGYALRATDGECLLRHSVSSFLCHAHNSVVYGSKPPEDLTCRFHGSQLRDSSRFSQDSLTGDFIEHIIYHRIAKNQVRSTGISGLKSLKLNLKLFELFQLVFLIFNFFAI